MTTSSRPGAAGTAALAAILAVPGTAPAALHAQGAAAAAPAGPAPSAAAPAAAPRFASARLATGVRLHYAELGDPAGAPIILLHGVTDSWFSFSRVLPALARHGRVLALDQRGHGRSDGPPARYTLPDLAADVVAFMDALGIERTTLVGHSMGSIVAQHVATRAPGRVERLVLIGSTADMRNDVLRELVQAVRELPDPVPDDFIRDFQRSTVYASVPDDFFETVVAESRLVPRHVWSAVFAGFADASALAPLDRVQAPTLLLWGERDAVFSRAEQDAIRRRIPHAELRVYAETGHALHWERPERFAEDVAAFLAGSGAR